MSVEYAGTLYDFTSQATKASLIDWATSCGTCSVQDAVEDISGNIHEYAEELASSVRDEDWEIVGVEDAGDPQVALELLLDFVEEFGS